MASRMRWHYWLIDRPARATEIAFLIYRWYFTIVLVVGSLVIWVSLTVSLALWFGFGIRWGW